ncbi:FHA domain-containing protein [Pendulispora albinea]|uniref:FHA domain-containing protein n=1 Tax=Pendulispora albinea TaxID=2741071 RepID=A0ABZ2LPZ0_9BACT
MSRVLPANTPTRVVCTLRAQRIERSVRGVEQQIVLLVHDLVNYQQFAYVPDCLPVAIGRDPEKAACALLNDLHVSRLHASVNLWGDELLVRDEKSKNGTLVDGERLMPGVWIIVGALTHAHELRIGGCSIHVIEGAVNIMRQLERDGRYELRGPGSPPPSRIRRTSPDRDNAHGSGSPAT